MDTVRLQGQSSKTYTVTYGCYIVLSQKEKEKARIQLSSNNSRE
jgi:hypothetical protein